MKILSWNCSFWLLLDRCSSVLTSQGKICYDLFAYLSEFWIDLHCDFQYFNLIGYYPLISDFLLLLVHSVSQLFIDFFYVCNFVSIHFLRFIFFTLNNTTTQKFINAILNILFYCPNFFFTIISLLTLSLSHYRIHKDINIL